MGQISPLDQLISSSAFNDCSVTVIYSGVIITDVLLLCDGPAAPSPSLFRADVIVFFGTTPASFTVVLCVFLLFPVLLNARLPRWPDSGTRVTASPDQRDCQASRKRRSHILPPMDQSQRGLFALEKTPTFILPCFLFALKPFLSSTLYYQKCIHVWMWVSMHVSNTFMCTVYVCKWECVHRLFEFQCVF